MAEPNSQTQVLTFDQNSLDDLKKTIIEANKEPRKRDIWEQSSIIGTFVSNVILAIVFFAFTYVYNTRQAEHGNRIKEAEVVHRFIPQLLSNNEREKEIALIAIANLTNPRLAIALAEQSPSKGSARATESFFKSSSGTPEDKKSAQDAYKRIIQALKKPKV